MHTPHIMRDHISVGVGFMLVKMGLNFREPTLLIPAHRANTLDESGQIIFACYNHIELTATFSILWDTLEDCIDPKSQEKCGHVLSQN
jgi:hypothetical protein